MKKHKSKVLKTELLKSKIIEALATYQDPYLAANLIETGCLKNLVINNNQVLLELHFGFLLSNYSAELVNKIHKLLNPIITDLTKDIDINLELEINCNNTIYPHVYQKDVEKIPNIKNIIAIGSGKGGVGKSTVAVNIAYALKMQGAKVGILDADLYGPSLPHMLGCTNKANIIDNKLEPHCSNGLYCISIGNLLEPESPVAWRGPMISGGLLQLLHDTLWPELDYLIVDLPPGTGDIQLTLAQRIPVSGVVIVTTPQPIALLDAQKALTMFEKLNITILGIVENMSSFICPNCNTQHNIFGTLGGHDMANKYGVRLFGNIPLDLNIRQQSDNGIPIITSLPNNNVSKIYHKIATSIAAQLSRLPVNLMASIGSPIVID